MIRKVLSLAMALCMIALVFTALPTKGEVHYTGTVQTMDETGMLKDTFFRGERIYVNVTLWYDNVLVDADIYVQIMSPDGAGMDIVVASTNDPAEGYYNSTISVPVDSLATNNINVDGEYGVCDVVLWADTMYDPVEVVREQIILREENLVLEPDPSFTYFPGQDVKVMLTTASQEEFYVQVFDPDAHELVLAQTHETADENGEWDWNFTIPADAPDGTYTVTARDETTDNLLWDNGWSESIAYFYVDKYDMGIYTDRSVVLPGEIVDVEYVVYDKSTLSLYTDVTTEWNAIWFDLDGEEQIDIGELDPAFNGTKKFTIPLDINMSSDYDIYFWVNDTAGRSSESWLSFSVGQLGGDVSTDSDSYMAEMVVTVEVDAWVEYDWIYYGEQDSLPGATIDITVEKDGSAIAAYEASGLETGLLGQVEHDFALAADSELGTYLVTATISKLGYEVVRMTTFEVVFDYDFSVDLDKTAYYGGESATATFTTMWGALEMNNNSVFYIVYTGVGDLISGTTSDGEVTFDIPMDFVGTLWIYALTSVEEHTMEDWDSASVAKAYIALAALVSEYSGGDTVQWEYRLMTAMTDGQLSYEIWSSTGELVASAEIAFAISGTISYTVPSDDPASWYEVIVTLRDGQGNSVSASSEVDIVSMYEIRAWIDNDSGYVGGAFEPGDEIRVAYEITTNGAAHKSVYKIRYYTSVDYIWMYVITTSTTGTMTFDVPDGATDGTFSIYVVLMDGVTDVDLSSDWLQYNVVEDQSGWDKEIAGMSAIDFTILVLIIVMIVLLIVVPFLKGRQGPIFKKKEPAPTPVPMEVPPPEPPAQ